MRRDQKKRFARAAIVVAVLALAVGLTLVFAMAGGSSRASKGHMFASKLAAQEVMGNRGEAERLPDGGDINAAAAEDYAAQAYPAAGIPLQATINAQQAWAGAKSRGLGRGHNRPGDWTLAGPSQANFPGVLTFSGADYTTSGRVTALAIDPSCFHGNCRVWAAAAGGGIWRTDHALSGNGTHWTFLSDSFATNAIGTLVYSNGVLYAGTGEPNASADSEAGMGLYKSTDGGDTWTHLVSHIGPITTFSPGAGTNGTYEGDAFLGRSISSVVVDPTNPSHIFVSSTRGVRGVSSVSSGGATSNPPIPRPPYGLFESTDGGANFHFIWDGGDGCPAVCNGTNPKASIRGVNEVRLDPGFGSTNSTVYAADFAATTAGSGGVWRSLDGGQSWSQIKPATNFALNTDRAEFALAPLAGGGLRMYVGDGNSSDSGSNRARFARTDDVRAASPVFTDMTTSQNIGYCTAQCWYDNVVYSPPGKPDTVYLGGSFSYGTYGHSTNGRAFIRSTDAGSSFTDMTWDATTGATPAGSCCQPNPIAPNGQHPDSHAIVEIPGTNAAIFGGDGGLMRSSGDFADISSQCTDRGLTGAGLATCQQLLSAVPTQLDDLNKGLSTLQFQSLSVAANNPSHLQGGTQDNGTFETYGSPVTWPQIIYGDGGQSGFKADDSTVRFNSFTGQFHDANFENGAPTKWVIISAPIAGSPEGSYFYAPIIADPNPAVAGSIFQGSQSVWRTQDWGGDPTYLEANCPEFTTSGTQPGCGDFVRIGSGNTDLTSASYGSRAGGFVARITRAAQNTGTMWVATGTGRVFITSNANDATPASVTFTRLDTLAANSPGRFVSGIAVDPSNANHAWISYSGYNFNTPSQPGHIFSVTYNPGAGTATWTSLDGSGSTAFPDFPATDVAFDSVTGDLYASNDFGVMRRASGSSDWTLAGAGLPQVETAGLTIVPGARKLYAATHGRSAWELTLP